MKKKNTGSLVLALLIILLVAASPFLPGKLEQLGIRLPGADKSVTQETEQEPVSEEPDDKAYIGDAEPGAGQEAAASDSLVETDAGQSSVQSSGQPEGADGAGKVQEPEQPVGADGMGEVQEPEQGDTGKVQEPEQPADADGADKAQNPEQPAPGENVQTSAPGGEITENGTYSSKDEVAAYIHQFGHLPSNYITKEDAQNLGWDSSKGNLWNVAPGMSIGGNRFGNREGRLPDAQGRKYTECDIDYHGGKRNAKRIVFSNDGLVFYTGDHYETFEQLY